MTYSGLEHSAEFILLTDGPLPGDLVPSLVTTTETRRAFG